MSHFFCLASGYLDISDLEVPQGISVSSWYTSISCDIGVLEDTGGYSKGSYRLTCTAQPGHGGKRRDSPEERVSSAIIELMHLIDHKPKYLIETQYSDITFGTLEWLGATSS